ncbi:hypothetical protein PUN28_004952 [Cardiocondyla obscurior]|uniref:Uncharacterized protein n=1 Tax=Cardiocondyla obscurior TaxID=286306 RepID=A0AAW2GI80_9HYME
MSYIFRGSAHSDFRPSLRREKPVSLDLELASELVKMGSVTSRGRKHLGAHYRDAIFESNEMRRTSSTSSQTDRGDIFGRERRYNLVYLISSERTSSPRPLRESRLALGICDSSSGNESGLNYL